MTVLYVPILDPNAVNIQRLFHMQAPKVPYLTYSHHNLSPPQEDNKTFKPVCLKATFVFVTAFYFRIKI